VDEPIMGHLVESTLDAVVFVADYLQLNFDDARLTTFAWPTVAIDRRVLGFGEVGYRDALCTFISHDVVAAHESAAEGLVVDFLLGSVTINPRTAGEVPGPEIAILEIHNGPYREQAWDVWRPGEGVFADRDWT
jgi:hypothetical protein